MNYCPLLNHPKEIAFTEHRNNCKREQDFKKHIKFTSHSDKTTLLCPPIVNSYQSLVRDPDKFKIKGFKNTDVYTQYRRSIGSILLSTSLITSMPHMRMSIWTMLKHQKQKMLEFLARYHLKHPQYNESSCSWCLCLLEWRLHYYTTSNYFTKMGHFLIRWTIFVSVNNSTVVLDMSPDSTCDQV